MALKALMLRKKIDLKRKALDALNEQRTALDAREAELTRSIEEVENEEQQAVVEEAVTELSNQRDALNTNIQECETEISGMETELAGLEEAQDTEPEQRSANPAPERREETMKKGVNTTRDRIAEMVTREDVQAYLGEVRTAIKEKRAITNAGLLIPEVMLGLIRENIENYSKLYKHVNVRRLGGTGRLVIGGPVPEGIWTDCCANLNELTIGFNDWEFDCYKVGGYFAVCNATLEDADIDLANELLNAIGQAIGLALDKAILYGRNASGTQKMPQGIVSRLVETAQPSGYPATARTWEDLSSTNVISIASTVTGADLVAAIVTASGAMGTKYARNAPVWVMNRKTYTKLMATLVNINASGAVVTGMGQTMPVVGGTIETLDFVADDVIIGGYFEDYILAERAGQQFATSDHVRFLADQTVMKGTARYDGAPVIAEAFVAIGINGVTPDATMTFATDTAN